MFLFFETLERGKNKMNLQYDQESREALKRFSLWRQFRMRAHGKKYFFGYEIPTGWTGMTPIFFIWCDECERYAKATPHGEENIRVRCLLCKAEYRAHELAPLSKWNYDKRPMRPEDVFVLSNRDNQ